MSFIKPPCIEGTGTAIAEERSVAAFDAIVLDVEADVTVTQGDNQSLVVTAQEEIQPIITTEVSNGVLTVAETECFSTSVGVKVATTIPTLQRVTVSSSGSITGTGLSLQNPEIVVSASGGVTLSDLTATGVTINITSSGDVELTGEAATLNINVSSSGEANAEEYVVGECDVTISGSGDARVNATNTLRATISGSGNIYYLGNPTIEKNITGSGELIPIE